MKRVGLFVGIDKYHNGIQELECASEDALALAMMFTKKGFDKVEHLLNEKATGDGIISKVMEMTSRLKPGDLFVLYFAGHGVEVDGKHCLIGVNGFRKAKVKQGRVEINELFDVSGEISGVRRMFILDCCRKDLDAGRSTAYACPESWNSRDISLGSEDAAAATAIPPFIITSCSSGEQAYERRGDGHGVFTQALCSVLGDAARPVRNFAKLIAGVDEKMRQLIPNPECPQHMNANFTPGVWNGFPLFRDWEDGAAQPAEPPKTDEDAEPVKPASEFRGRSRTDEDAEAQFLLGLRCANGEGGAQDPAGAVEWFRKAAGNGHAGAQYELGECLAEGRGTATDMPEAVKWYRKAAEQGHPGAQYRLGQYFRIGGERSDTYARAAEYFQKAAEQEHADAQYEYGMCFLRGEGVKPDPERAFEWLSKAAEQGHSGAKKELPEAQYRLGKHYCELAEWDEAIKCLSKAADQGHADAKKELPEAKYQLGKQCLRTKNPAEAVELFSQAADAGHPKAKKELPEAQYRFGTECLKANMLKTAVEWLSKAADAGHAEAKKKLDYAQSQLPESQYWKAREYFIGGKIAEAAQCLRKSGRSIRMGDFIDSKVVGVSLFLIRLFLCDVACVLGVICYWTPIFVLNQKGWFEIFCYGVVTITPVLVLVLMCGGSEALQSYFRYKRLLMMMKSGDGK